MPTIDLQDFIPTGSELEPNDRPLNQVWADFLEYAFGQANPQGATAVQHVRFYNVCERLRTLRGTAFELSDTEFSFLRSMLLDAGRFPANVNRMLAQILRAFGISAA